ncbi:hypothetical protein QBZ16_004217 [Prototheca wickerhamii]|uniref:USP domain-containing protein n=1 Tax=Prototheca wickerhamii TaxID=3111 RepID=A0AAD9MHU6_PROWI|nr:hypothetical protein QBZ16_004217 [Prototheca wickerhamii]
MVLLKRERSPSPGPHGFVRLMDDGFPPGLRGLHNLGNTCFMNSDGLISAAYSGCRAPISPASFLHTWWTYIGGELSRHAQQDAHEFLVFFLDALSAIQGYPLNETFQGLLESEVACRACQHSSVTEDRFLHLSLDIPPVSRLIAPPIAIADAAGAETGGAGPGPDPALQSERSSELESSSLLLSPLGSQESELLMAREGANGDDPLSSPRPSSYSSPFGKEPEGAAVGDDARPASADRVAPAPPPGIGSPGIDEDAALTSYSRWPGVSLLGALRRLTHTELLGAAGSSWRCAACGASQGATKRLSLAKLPPVLVLHAKRFEHSGLRGTATKLNTFLEYPLENLDMSPFLSARAKAAGSLYDLYGVVVHKGDFKGGHYVTYVKCRDGAWYLCDDAFISPASCEEVQNSQAYLLFYMDKSIDPWTVQ